MKPVSAFALLLVYLTAWAKASQGAGSVQTVYLWIAFQLDIQAYNADPASWKRRIAPGLSTTSTFDDFLLGIYHPNSKASFRPTGLSAADVDISTIDITQVAAALDATGYKNNQDKLVLLPELPTDATTFSKLYDPIVQIVESASEALGMTAPVKAALNKAATCWSVVVSAREYENRDGLSKALNALIASPKFKKYGITISTFTNGEIDFETTLKSATSEPSSLIVSMFKNFQNGKYDDLLKQNTDMGLKREVKTYTGHRSAITTSQKYLSLLKSMC